MRSKESYEKEYSKHSQIDEYEQIVCPHCYQKFDDPTDLSLNYDGDDEEGVECEHCQKKFNVKVQVEKTYITTRVVEEEE